jgi:hypothetical protein
MFDGIGTESSEADLSRYYQMLMPGTVSRHLGETDGVLVSSAQSSI